MSEQIIGMGDNNGHMGRNIDDIRGFMEDLVLADEIKRVRCYVNFVMQSTYASATNGFERLTRRR